MKLLLHAAAVLFMYAATPAFAQLISHPAAPVRVGHYHLNVTSIEEHKKFWVNTLGGTAIKVGGIDVVKFPDALIFLRLQKPTGPTRGTAFDHIGFEVKNLEVFCKALEAKGIKLAWPYTKNTPAMNGIATAIVIDPWGVSIELTEGLDKL